MSECYTTYRECYPLFKKSLHDTVLPDDWKRATVTPIFKKGNRDRAENYRPVSLN